MRRNLRLLLEIVLLITSLIAIVVWINAQLVHPIDKSQFGHSTWIYLHGLVESLPDNNSGDAFKVVDIIRYTFDTYPCIECRVHVLEDVQQNPIPSQTADKRSLRKFLFDLHNRVNVRCGKTTLTKEAYKVQWSNFNGRTGAFRCKECERH